VLEAKLSSWKIPLEWKNKLDLATIEAEKMVGDIAKVESSAYERKKWSKGGKESKRRLSK
jgi:hypothetical protein